MINDVLEELVFSLNLYIQYNSVLISYFDLVTGQVIKKTKNKKNEEV